MAVNEEKMNKFYVAINHYAHEQRRKIEREVQDFKEKELGEAEIGVLTEAYRLIQKEMADMRSAISREMALREMDSRRALLAKRKKITDEVFRRAAEKLRAFTGQDGYSALLRKSAQRLAEVFRAPGTVLFIRPEDKKYEQEIRRAFGGECSVEEDPAIALGGIRARNAEMGIAADETLDSLLENQRPWFEENSGMTVI